MLTPLIIYLLNFCGEILQPTNHLYQHPTEPPKHWYKILTVKIIQKSQTP